MNGITRGDIREIIDSTLSIEPKKDDVLSEAYVANVKSYDFPTELLSEKAKKMHHALYEGYVKALNNVNTHLDSVDRQNATSHGSAYRSLKMDETYNLNAVWLHELFFANMSDVHSEIMTDSLAFMRLERDFGDFSSFQWDFIANAMSCRSGWAVCGYNMFLQRYMNFFIDGHDCHVPMGVYPTIVVDMWEHAAHDYLDQKIDYLYGQMKELRWGVIEERFKRAELLAAALVQK